MRNVNPSGISRSHKAFTLVEMLVVIAIIAILLAGGAAVMRSGTDASSVRVGADTLQNMSELARGAAIGRGTEARLLISNNSSDDGYLRKAMVVAAEPEGNGAYTWRPIGEARELPGGVYYAKGQGATLGSEGEFGSWGLINIDATTVSTEFGKALNEQGYDSASAWIAVAFDGNGRVINPGLSSNPVIALNRGFIEGDTVTTPAKFRKYAEGFTIIRSTGRPIRLADTYEQAGLGN